MKWLQDWSLMGSKEVVRERLIIFTRYPEPGKTKTRLIPALGPEGAATLQRQMTEYTLAQARAIQGLCRISVEIRFTGGNASGEPLRDRHLIQSWLGSDLSYQCQGQGDLGTRMKRGFETAFQASMDHVVTIGTDCPSLDAQLLVKAFQVLRQHDLVLGPATDGGYYLIGLRRLIPELFEGITWGTAEVFQQTVEIAENLELLIAYLAPRQDIDRPEDLSSLDFGFPLAKRFRRNFSDYSDVDKI